MGGGLAWIVFAKDTGEPRRAINWRRLSSNSLTFGDIPLCGSTVHKSKSLSCYTNATDDVISNVDFFFVKWTLGWVLLSNELVRIRCILCIPKEEDLCTGLTRQLNVRRCQLVSMRRAISPCFFYKRCVICSLFFFLSENCGFIRPWWICSKLEFWRKWMGEEQCFLSCAFHAEGMLWIDHDEQGLCDKAGSSTKFKKKKKKKSITWRREEGEPASGQLGQRENRKLHPWGVFGRWILWLLAGYCYEALEWGGQSEGYTAVSYGIKIGEGGSGMKLHLACKRVQLSVPLPTSSSKTFPIYLQYVYHFQHNRVGTISLELRHRPRNVGGSISLHFICFIRISSGMKSTRTSPPATGKTNHTMSHDVWGGGIIQYCSQQTSFGEAGWPVLSQLETRSIPHGFSPVEFSRWTPLLSAQGRFVVLKKKR